MTENLSTENIAGSGVEEQPKVTVSDALKKISYAEERALKIREDAKLKAREISKSAAEECEAIKAEYAAATKSEIAAIMAEANSKADKEELDAKKAAEQSSRDAARAAEKNIRSVGDWLADMLVKGKY